MSEFTPNRKVRCIDCTKYSGGVCLGRKNKSQTAARKRRVCKIYEFSGEIKNREPLPSEFRPFWWFYSNKEKKLLSHLMAMGIQPVSDDSPMVVPQSTAVLPLVAPESDSFKISVGETGVGEINSGS